jgi:aminoglycoside phosphotransferase family enzyme/predicted kinase
MIGSHTSTRSPGVYDSVNPDRDALLAALGRPAAYPHAAETVQCHETHLSWVFLAGAYAYKLKKPVDFGFVDFTTRARRAAACAEEVRLNRRLCSDIYLGVVEIVARDGTFWIGGPGEVVETAVKMRRLPDAGMLPALLERSAADTNLMRRIAIQLAQFHATAATGPGLDEWGRADAISANWAENFAQTAIVDETVLPATVVTTVQAFVTRFIGMEVALFARRVAQGRVRDGHGDLHARNICVEGRRIHLFDCLEFSPRYRCADVAAEVAFLAMDLAAHGRADLAHDFVGTYVRDSGDQELKTLLDFYVCYRAWTRGKVQALRLAEPYLSVTARAAVIDEAQRYFHLAWAAAGGLQQPVLVVTLGLPASGKTRLARELAGHLGLIHLSSDMLRKELGGQRPTAHCETRFGQGLYGPTMTHRTYGALRRRAGRWLRQGRSVVLDATYGQPAERVAVRRLAERCGARLVILYCQADDATLRARLAAREHDPFTVSDARLPLWAALRASFVPPVAAPELLALDMAGPFDAALDRALGALGVPTDDPLR